MKGKLQTGAPRKRGAARFLPQMPVSPDERELAGRVSGLMYIVGGLTFSSFALLPGVTHANTGWVVALSGLALGWGVCLLWLIDWSRAPGWLTHGSTAASLVVIALAVAATGGADSSAWIYLFFVVLFTAYFYPPAIAATYVLATVAVHVLPFTYDGNAWRGDFPTQLTVGTATCAGLAFAIASGKRLTSTLRHRAEHLAAEQSSLRRVATAVVDGQPAERVYDLVSAEAAALLGATAARILRRDGPSKATVMGSWAQLPSTRHETGRVIEVRPGSELAEALEAGRPARVAKTSQPPDGPLPGLRYGSTIVTPVRVDGRVWGALAVSCDAGVGLRAEDESQLEEFADLLSTAVTNIEDRAKLADQASNDPLTGLANHRTVHAQLATDMARSRRHREVMSVAVLDIDEFKQYNDTGGHDAGDELLLCVAEGLRRLARAEDTLGRTGGDEFVWIMPRSSHQGALQAVKRARQLIADGVPEPLHATLSVGICDSTVTEDPSELIRFADDALYWSKANGRDQCWIYDSAVVADFSAQERAARLERSQVITGLRALARAIDARDPATREHSEHVSALAGRLARLVGWSAERAMLLSEAALLHDIGKMVIPVALLGKPGPLTDAEWTQIQSHAELSAQIVECVLTDEQVEWIRSHHERPDGRGYPRRLREPAISNGAALLSLADAWDVMTVSRPFGVPKELTAALEECRELRGTQFSALAVDALLALHRRGELADAVRVELGPAEGGPESDGARVDEARAHEADAAIVVGGGPGHAEAAPQAR